MKIGRVYYVHKYNIFNVILINLIGKDLIIKDLLYYQIYSRHCIYTETSKNDNITGI